jgi:hypothetical protein
MLSDPPAVAGPIVQVQGWPQIGTHGREHITWNQGENVVASCKHEPMMIVWPGEMHRSLF